MLESTMAGSLPKPDWLAEPEKLWAPWRFRGEALIQAQERAAVADGFIKAQGRSGGSGRGHCRQGGGSGRSGRHDPFGHAACGCRTALSLYQLRDGADPL
jgi:hypothetical protein